MKSHGTRVKRLALFNNRFVCGVLLSAILLLIFSQTSTASLKEVARISVGKEPLGITARNTQILVVSAADRLVHGIDAESLKITATLDLKTYGRLNRVFTHPDTGEHFVTASVQGAVLKLSPSLDRVLGKATVGGFPQGMALAGQNLLVALTGGQAVGIVEPITMTSVRAVDAGDRPTLVRHDKISDRILVLKSTTRSIWVYDTATMEHTGTISNPSLVRLADMAISPTGQVLLLDTSQDILMVLNKSGQSLDAEISLNDPQCQDCGEHFPMALSLTPKGDRAAVVGRSGRLSIIDLKAGRLIANRLVGKDLRGVAWGPKNRVFVTSFATGEVVVLDGTPE